MVKILLLICHINYYPLIDAKFTTESLLHVEKEDLEILIPDSEIGLRIQLRSKIQEFKNQNVIYFTLIFILRSKHF